MPWVIREPIKLMPANWYSTSLPLSRELYSSPQQFLRHQQPLQYALQLILCTLNLVLGPEICMNVFNQRSVCTNQTWCFTSFLKYLKFQKYISTDHGWINSIFFQACILHYSYLRGKKQHQQQQKNNNNFHTAQLNPNVVFKTYYIFVPVGGLSVCELEEFI